MLRYVLTRLLLTTPTLLVVSMVVFAAMRLIPGDPVRNQLGLDADPAVAAQLVKDYGLDQPMPVQYVRWLGRVLVGDWGDSLFTKRPVLVDLLQRIPISIELVVLSMLAAFVIAVPIGIAAALARGRPLDLGLMSLSVVGISLPEFLVGAVLIYVFALRLGWLQAAGFARLEVDPGANLKALLLPGLALGFARAALLTRLVRTEMLETFGQDFMRTARAKGLRELAVVLGHGLKNAMLPVVTVAGLQVGATLGGSVVVESLFVIPGLGTYGIVAMQKRDYPAIQGFVLLVAIGFLAANLVVDLTYAWLDPRIRFGEGR